MIFLLFFMGVALLLIAGASVNQETTGGDVVGVVLFVVGVVVMAFLVFADYTKITECEKQLTRDEHCVLIAVPEKQIEENTND